MCGVRLQTAAIYAATGLIYAASGACAAHLLANSAMSITRGALTGVAGSIFGSLCITKLMINENERAPAEKNPKVRLVALMVIHACTSFMGSMGISYLSRIPMASRSIVVFSSMTSGIALGIASVVVVLGMNILLGLILDAFNPRANS